VTANTTFSNPAQPFTPVGVASQLQEALVMAGMVSLRNDLSVELGEFWAFNWKTNVITLPLQELRTCPKEEICWIILHEAAHAALTRLHHILPQEVMRREEVHMLLNAVEDVRIENWLVRRFPGSKPWKDVSDAISVESGPSSPQEVAAEPPAWAFLRGLIHFGNTAELPQNICKAAKEALEEVLPPLQLAFDCVPPAAAVGAVSVEALYNSHPVSRSYLLVDSTAEPSPFEKWVRIMQASMWFHVAGQVLPVFLKLVEKFGCPTHPARRTVRVVQTPLTARPRKRNPEELQKALRDELANGGSGRYLETVKKHAQHVQSITETLMLLLPNHRGLKHVRRCPTGDRLDLRAAAQFEADPRLHEELWMRRRRRTLPDPAFLFLMDRSSSMRENSKCVAAFESLVLLRETCTRVGIPFSVLMFNSDPDIIHHWDQIEDAAAEAALSAILRPEGGTSIVNGLTLGLELLDARREEDRILFLMTDGEVCDDEKAAVRELKRDAEARDIKLVPFGIGTEAANISEMFPGAQLIPSARALPEVLARSLVKVIERIQG
jgi:hypothetical protein